MILIMKNGFFVNMLKIFASLDLCHLFFYFRVEKHNFIFLKIWL